MSTRTVEWPAPRPSGTGAPEAGGLRERLMRQQLSDTATQMGMDRGFDDVRVAEVAEACGVSEKTVFNYFPTKESLILDRLEATMASLRTGLAEPGVSPVEAALRILDDELGAMTSWLVRQDDPAGAGAAIRRFGTLIQDTPSLRAYQSDMMDQFTGVAAAILAGRAGMSPDDPEPLRLSRRDRPALHRAGARQRLPGPDRSACRRAQRRRQGPVRRADRAQHPRARLHLRARPPDRPPDAAEGPPGRAGPAGARTRAR
jgi:AcrR family transcriptional regulator